MRRILLVLAALALTIPAAEAARQGDETRQQASRQGNQASQRAKPASGAARQTSRQQTTGQQATRTASSRSQATRSREAASTARNGRHQTTRQTSRTADAGDVRTSTRGLVVRGASAATISRDAMANCSRNNGRTICGQARSSVAGWQSGLPAADYAQRECPEGTFATLARGHDNVVRCMPI